MNTTSNASVNVSSKTSSVPAEISFGGSRVVFNDVTNRTKANDSKSGKPNAYKGGAMNKTRVVARKRDAPADASFRDDKRLALKSLDKKVDEAAMTIEGGAKNTAEDKRVALRSLKEGANDVTAAIEAEAKTLSRSLTDSNPFKNVTQSPEKYETIDLEKPIVASVENYHDIDARDADDEVCVTGYVEEMYEYFREQEERACVDPDYILYQKEISPRMRAILVDWLALVTHRSRLSPEVLYLTVNILDRYLSLKKVTKKNLQLVGIAALFIASKYEDIYHVPVDDLVYLCDRAYTTEQIYETETKILKALNHQISFPTVYKFLMRYLNAGHADKEIVHLSAYILELTVLSIEFIEYLPSELAAAAVFIARKTVGRNGWSPTLVKYAECTEEDVIPTARAIVKAASKLDSGLTSSKKRYTSDRKLKVALLPLARDF